MTRPPALIGATQAWWLTNRLAALAKAVVLACDDGDGGLDLRVHGATLVDEMSSAMFELLGILDRQRDHDDRNGRERDGARG